MEQMELEDQIDVPMLRLVSAQVAPIEGNFAEVADCLIRREQEISAMELTAENLAQVKTVKKAVVAYRTRLTRLAGEAKKAFFTEPKAIFEMKMEKLFVIINRTESLIDEVLKKEEDARIANLTEIFDMYKTRFQETYQLEDSYLSRVQYKKQYYNKTASEKDTKDDLEAQFKTLKKEQETHAANVRLVNNACADTVLNPAHFMEMLARDDIAVILERIESEKRRVQGLPPNPPEEPPPHAAKTIAFPEPARQSVSGEAGFPRHIKSMRIEITYPSDCGAVLTELFKDLRKKHGITVKQIKEPAAEPVSEEYRYAY
jgi:hypothetical protein